MQDNQAKRDDFKQAGVIVHREDCILCLGKLDLDENKRGIIEFVDGWFWICSGCRLTVGDILDMTQRFDVKHDIPPYHATSRKSWLRYLVKEHNIIIHERA